MRHSSCTPVIYLDTYLIRHLDLYYIISSWNAETCARSVVFRNEFSPTTTKDKGRQRLVGVQVEERQNHRIVSSGWTIMDLTEISVDEMEHPSSKARENPNHLSSGCWPSFVAVIHDNVPLQTRYYYTHNFFFPFPFSYSISHPQTSVSKARLPPAKLLFQPTTWSPGQPTPFYNKI